MSVVDMEEALSSSSDIPLLWWWAFESSPLITPNNYAREVAPEWTKQFAASSNFLD